ncbi:MAG: DUF721 domain-containing protein [Puniceicoccales bacterium]|jgi:hypothetical protein|nr:DUF721 domain-containing protein [Puniceicoccales bacterium]
MKFSRKIQNLIADFRSLPRDDSLSALRDECHISQLFHKIFKKYTIKSSAEIGAEVLENWPRIAGNALSKLCTPHSITAAGALAVRVQNGVVRQELFLQKEKILQRIHEICPQSGVGDIVFSL